MTRKDNLCSPFSVLKEGVFLKRLVGIVLALSIVFIFLPKLEVWASPMVEEIQVKGNQYIDTEEILQVIKSKVGEPLSEQRIREDIQAIYDIGFFSYLSALKEKKKDGLIIIFQVEENKIINEISFEDIDGKEVNEIKKLLTFKEKDLFNFIQVKKSKDKITQFYYKKGFLAASVNISNENDESNGCKVIVNIQKGEIVRVKRVELKGNSSFSDSQVRALIKTRYGRFFDQQILKEDLKKIVHFYQNHGYYFAYFKSPDFEFSEEKDIEWVTIFLEMVEGRQFFVSQVEIRGENKVFSESEIMSQFKPSKGELLVPDYIKDSINFLQDKYGERGYIHIQIKSDLDFDREGGKVNILLHIEEGPQVSIGKIRIEGNKLSQERIFKHAFTLKEGDIFDIKEAREGWRRLYNLGFFESVEIEPIAISSSIVDLLIKVKEIEREGQFYIGGGYNTASGLQGEIQFFKDNLWGEGKRIGIDWQFAEKRNEYNITYLDRWWGDTSIHLEPRIYKRKDIYNEIDGGYEKETTGIEMKIGKPIWKFSNIYISLRDERIYIDKGVNGEISEETEEGGKTSHSLKFILDRDTRVRDEAFNPYQGSYSYVSADITGGPMLGGEFTFTKYGGEWRGYLRKSSFWKYPIITCRLRVKSGENLPVYEKFHIGGMETLRGYRQNEFIGEKLILGNFELRLPLDKNFLTYLFLDTGQIRNEDSSIYKVGWGFGIRIKTIIGFIRLDYGIGEEGGQLYFGMGEGF